MALTNFLDNQITNSIVRGQSITTSNGSLLALSREDPLGNLIVLDFSRVPIVPFVTITSVRYNSAPITFVNDALFTEYVSHVLVMSSEQNPLFAIPLPEGETLVPNETLILPGFSLRVDAFEDLIKSKHPIFSTHILPQRTIMTPSSISLNTSSSAIVNIPPAFASSNISLSSSASSSVKINGSAYSSVSFSGDGL